jgi:DNA-binding transcriptional regulator YdaS (Cro superfamily)
MASPSFSRWAALTVPDPGRTPTTPRCTRPEGDEQTARRKLVEYRIEQHLDRPGNRLERLGLASPSVTGNVTGSRAAGGTKNPHATEVTTGEELPESGRPDSNWRRPAWEASDPDADQRPPA